VLTNRAAERGEGLWAPLEPGAPLDLMMIGVAVVLAARLPRSRPRIWELIVLTALAVLTIKTGRSGVWLLLFLAPLAARTFKSRPAWDRLLPSLATVALVVLVLVSIRGPSSLGASPQLVDRAIALSHGGPVLAEDVFAEQVALAGGKILVGNPIDAFSRPAQDVYLDWLAGNPAGRLAIAPAVSVVLTRPGTPAERLMSDDPAFRLAADDGRAVLFTRAPAVAYASRYATRTGIRTGTGTATRRLTRVTAPWSSGRLDQAPTSRPDRSATIASTAAVPARDTIGAS
jgi:hypothetical protein